MEEDMHRVTQEELEANLSTECPEMEYDNVITDMEIDHDVNSIHRQPHRQSLEQLVQSVLEDSSTQEPFLSIDKSQTLPSELVERLGMQEANLRSTPQNGFYTTEDIHHMEVVRNSDHDVDRSDSIYDSDNESCVTTVSVGRLFWNENNPTQNSNVSEFTEKEKRSTSDVNSIDFMDCFDAKYGQLKGIMNDHCYLPPELVYQLLNMKELRVNLVKHFRMITNGLIGDAQLFLLINRLLLEINETNIEKILHVFEKPNGLDNNYQSSIGLPKDEITYSTVATQTEIIKNFHNQEIIKSTSTFINQVQSVDLVNDNMNTSNELDSNNISNNNITMNTSVSSSSVPELLQRLTQFANTLTNKCASFATNSKNNIDEELENFVKEHCNQLTSLFPSNNEEIHNISAPIQKLNLESKISLLTNSDSSNTSSGSNSSDSSRCCSPLLEHSELSDTGVYSNKEKSEISTEKIFCKSTQDLKTSCASDSYNESNINKSENDCENILVNNDKEFIVSSNFKEDLKTMETNENVIVDKVVENSCELPRNKSPTIGNASDTLSTHSESDKENIVSRAGDTSDDEIDKTDREVERLINIDSLMKRPTYKSTSNKSNAGKSKKVVVSSNTKDDSFIIGDEDFASDDSKRESDDDAITEAEYLKRCNEEYKKSLLDESSTDLDDSDDFTDENDIDSQPSSNDEDVENNENSTPVQKFLKTYHVQDNNKDSRNNEKDLVTENNEGSENQERNQNHESLKSIVSDFLVNDDKKQQIDKEQSEHNVDVTMEKQVIENRDENYNNGDDNVFDEIGNDSKSLTKVDENVSNTSSDAELVSENFQNHKSNNSVPRDITNRRQRLNIDEDLICLSSDSEDVEEIDEESDENSNVRAIKPMLRPDQLASETIKAQKCENERIARLEKKQAMLNKVLKENSHINKSKELILDYNKDTKSFIKVHPSIVQYLKHHQCDGVRFMYDSCYGGIDSLKKSQGSGCILAHCMGLGKTLQLIALLHTVISYKELKTTKVLVLCPKSTVINWAEEITRWLEPLRQKNLKVYSFNDTCDMTEKLNIMREWSKSDNERSGCLIIGYEAFRTMIFYHSYKKRGNMTSHRLEQIRKNVEDFLLNPGADLVVCDEGHIIKNSKSAISLAVSKISTPRRIVLTGTPIQNNLKEYYSMVNFIKPLFLGTEKEFANLYANPIRNGQHKDSSKADIKVMKQRSFVLHKKLSKFVQRKEAELLKTFLPPKYEYVLFIPMTEVQNNLYTFILKTIENRGEYHRGRGLVTDYTCLRKIWTHPKVLEDAWRNAINLRNKKDREKDVRSRNQSDDDQPDDIYDSQTGQMSVINDWWRHLLSENDLKSIMPSNKLRTMFNILQMCEEKGEKCLIFSAFVAVLNVVEYFFERINQRDPQILKELHINPNSNTRWVFGEDYYRLDGKTPKSIRHENIKVYNDVNNNRARVFLISAKAGGQGINLIGANRVIILDTSWNPSNDQQNIFRVFRLGQKRSCYIYRLIAMGTMEEKVYSRSVTKQAMSFRVVDEQQIDRHYSMAELTELYTLTKPDQMSRPTPILPQDSILARLLRLFPDLVYKYHEHDSLLENKIEQELSEQEKTEAWAAYERDLLFNSEAREYSNADMSQNSLVNSQFQDYLSPFSGLDVSNNNSNNVNKKNLFNYRAFTEQFLSPMNRNPCFGPQHYVDFYNYYKNNSYAELNNYKTALAANANLLHRYSGAGLPPPSSTSLSALGEMSMLSANAALSSTNLVNAAVSNLGISNNNLPSMLPPLQPPPNHSGLYNSSVLPPSLHTNPNQLSASGNNPLSLLNSYEQYNSSFIGSYSHMYNYANDFRLSPSVSPILDKSKTTSMGKTSQPLNSTTSLPSLSSFSLSSTSSNSLLAASAQKNTNLPGGLATNNASLYPTSKTTSKHSQSNKSSLYTTSPTSNDYSKTNSRNESNVNKDSATSFSTLQEAMNDFFNYKRKNQTSNVNPLLIDVATTTTITSSMISREIVTNSDASSINRSTLALPNLIPLANSVQSKTNNFNENSTICKVTTATNTNTNSTQNFLNRYKTNTQINDLPTGMVSTNACLPALSSLNITTTSTMIMPTISSNATSTTPFSSLTTNMVYTNKGNNTISSTTGTSLNIGIVYPKTVNTTLNEMQIIPTSSPPGTASISKQLNALSPSISLTALQTNTTGVQQQAKQHNIGQSNIAASTINNKNKISGVLPKRSSFSITNSTPNVNNVNNVKNSIDGIQFNRSGLTITPKKITTNDLNSNYSGKMVKTSNSCQTTAIAKQTAISVMARFNGTTTTQPNLLQNTASGLKISAVTGAIPMTGSNRSSTPVTSLSPVENLSIAAVKETIIRRGSPLTIVPANNKLLTVASISSTTTTSTCNPSMIGIRRVSITKSKDRNKNCVDNAAYSIIKSHLSKNVSNNCRSQNKPLPSSLKLSKAILGKDRQSSSIRVGPPLTISSTRPTVASTTLTSTTLSLSSSSPSLLSTTCYSLPMTSSSSSVNIARNTVSIRPLDGNQSNGSTIRPSNNYIIEANINDKKLAIGTPTKNGGGTSVSKVNIMKRKTSEHTTKNYNTLVKQIKK